MKNEENKILLHKGFPITYKTIDKNDDCLTINLTSILNKHLRIEYDGDIEFKINGEFSFLTTDNPINFDSLNSKIYLNSRKCKYIRDIDKTQKNIEKKETNNNENDINMYCIIQQLYENILFLQMQNQQLYDEIKILKEKMGEKRICLD